MKKKPKIDNSRSFKKTIKPVKAWGILRGKKLLKFVSAKHEWAWAASVITDKIVRVEIRPIRA